MRKFLVTRNVVTDEATVSLVHFTVNAVNGPTAGRHGDRGKRTMEADAGTAPPVTNRESAVGDHLYTLPFAGLSDVMFPGRKRAKGKGRKRNRKSK